MHFAAIRANRLQLSSGPPMENEVASNFLVTAARRLTQCLRLSAPAGVSRSKGVSPRSQKRAKYLGVKLTVLTLTPSGQICKLHRSEHNPDRRGEIMLK
jgi:hypothetical protein